MAPHNRMQLTRSARGEGGYAPPSQLIRVLGGHEELGDAKGMRILSGVTVSLIALCCSVAESPRVLYHNRLDSLDGIISRADVTLDPSTSRGIASFCPEMAFDDREAIIFQRLTTEQGCCWSA